MNVFMNVFMNVKTMNENKLFQFLVGDCQLLTVEIKPIRPPNVPPSIYKVFT